MQCLFGLLLIVGGLEILLTGASAAMGGALLAIGVTEWAALFHQAVLAASDEEIRQARLGLGHRGDHDPLLASRAVASS